MNMKKKIITLLLLLSVLNLNTINVNAATKDLNFTLDNDYSACTFTFDCESSGNYSGTVTSPKGDTYNLSNIDDDTLSTTIDRVKSGTWTAQITDDGKSDIGKVKISVKAANKNTTDVVDKNIKVGKDISGLKSYFINNNLIVEWADDTVGTVAVSVVDLDNSKALANEKVSNQSFSCEIPNGIKNISLSVVPTSSANIDGAASVTTLVYNDERNATVNYPSETVTNKDIITTNVTLNETYSIKAYVNGAEVYSKENEAPGDYSYDIPLEDEGDNKIELYIIDSNGNMKSYDNIIKKDITPPELKLKEEYDGMKTTDNSVTVEGTISNYKTLKINDEDISVATDGAFSYKCNLHMGVNEIVVVATDDAGNEAKMSLNITETEAKKKSPIPIIILLVAIIFGFIFYKKKKQKRNIESKSNNTFQNVSNIKIPQSPVADEVQKSTTKQVVSNNKQIQKPLVSHKKKSNHTGERVKVQGSDKMDIKTFCSTYKTPLKLIIFVLVLYFIFSRVFLVGTAISGSMEPNFMTKDFALYNRLSYLGNNEPQHGDIISFYHDGDTWCKRVIGIPGDVISFQDGYVFINDTQLEETYLENDVETNCMKEFTVPENKLFVLGDNREYSYDSRYWEDAFVDKSDVIAKMIFIIPSHNVF